MSVAYVNIDGFGGQIPVTSPAYVPGGAGNQILVFGGCSQGSALSFTMSGSASTLSALSISGDTNVTDGIGTYAVWDTLACASGSQTFSVTQPNGDYINSPFGFIVEFSGAASIKNALYTVTNNPGAGTGAILGQAVTVASTDLLVAILTDGSNVVGTNATIATPASSTIAVNYGPGTIAYWTGTGGFMTPTATAPSGQTTDTWIIIQLVMSATGAASGATIAWLT